MTSPTAGSPKLVLGRPPWCVHQQHQQPGSQQKSSCARAVVRIRIYMYRIHPQIESYGSQAGSARKGHPPAAAAPLFLESAATAPASHPRKALDALFLECQLVASSIFVYIILSYMYLSTGSLFPPLCSSLSLSNARCQSQKPYNLGNQVFNQRSLRRFCNHTRCKVCSSRVLSWW